MVGDLTAAGYDVAVIERDENNRFLSSAAELDVPVIFGDATLRQTLESARVDHARAVAVLTQDDMVNIETGIVLREMLGAPVHARVIRSDVPLVLRVYDRALGAAVAQRFGFENVRSTVELAAPWFIGAAMGLQVLGTFSVGQRSFMVGGMHVAAGSELDGHADVRAVDPDPRHRDHPAGRAGHAASAPRRPAAWRRHRLPRRPVPRAAGNAAQGAASQQSADERRSGAGLELRAATSAARRSWSRSELVGMS